MAGTDRSRDPLSGGPAVILVETQLAENIGAAARAMYNFGLTELRLVNPRDGWPNPRAYAAASGADVVLDAAVRFDTLEVAIADLTAVYATSARPREMIKPVVTPRHAAAEARSHRAAGNRVGLMFGAERTGLLNEQLTLADVIVAIPANPAFASLNVAQAVLLVSYEWFMAGDATAPVVLDPGRSFPAPKADLEQFFGHLEAELDASGFLYPPEKRPSMVQNIRAMFLRAGLMEQEIRTLRGVVKALAQGRERGAGARRRARAKGEPDEDGGAV